MNIQCTLWAGHTAREIRTQFLSSLIFFHFLWFIYAYIYCFYLTKLVESLAKKFFRHYFICWCRWDALLGLFIIYFVCLCLFLLSLFCLNVENCSWCIVNYKQYVKNACVNGNKQTKFLVFIEKFTNLKIYDFMLIQSKQNKISGKVCH